MTKTENAKAPDSDEKAKEGEQGFLADIWELAWFPLLLAIVAVAITWIVWCKTTEPCTDKMTTGCRSSGWGAYTNLDLLNKMFVHGGIAGGFGSIWSYVMLTRERRAREAAEQRARDAIQRADEIERRASQERQQASQERQQWLEEIRQLREQITNGNHTR